jgi:hypothetical protein
MHNTGIILTLAYPETIVMISDEWFLKYLHFLGIGKKHYVRAGHAALVLIDKETGHLEYYDFGRYISPLGTGRVRSKETDHELDLPFKAIIKDNTIDNLDEILIYLATHPKITHGSGTMYASLCDQVDYDSTKSFIEGMQESYFIRYAVFAKNATNCARFVTDALIAGVTNLSIKKKLISSYSFTPSTIGNVVKSDTKKKIYKVSYKGDIVIFKPSIFKLNRAFFLDQLKEHQPNLSGNLEPKHNNTKQENAQWLSGIGGGAWFELYDLNHELEYRFRRVSPYGNIDVDAVYNIVSKGFDIQSDYEFTYDSNCKYFHIKQGETIHRFEYLRRHE